MICQKISNHRSGTAVYLTVYNQNSSHCRVLQSDIEHLQKWERILEMELNPSKCQVLHINKTMQAIQLQYTLHGKILESVEVSFGAQLQTCLRSTISIYTIT